MARRNRRRVDDPGDEPRPLSALGERRESWRGEQYAVRPITGSGATKTYRCPGCDQEVRVGLPHVVVWPVFDADAEDRRHWHTACWAARDRRAPGVQRGRSAPRY